MSSKQNLHLWSTTILQGTSQDDLIHENAVWNSLIAYSDKTNVLTDQLLQLLCSGIATLGPLWFIFVNCYY